MHIQVFVNPHKLEGLLVFDHDIDGTGGWGRFSLFFVDWIRYGNPAFPSVLVIITRSPQTIASLYGHLNWFGPSPQEGIDIVANGSSCQYLFRILPFDLILISDRLMLQNWIMNMSECGLTILIVGRCCWNKNRALEIWNQEFRNMQKKVCGCYNIWFQISLVL